ncbi:MAG: type III-B CRISPR module RAMP protein Cmr4 [Chloroflexota bacterium]
MFEETRMLFIYVETPLHAGSGRSLGVVDLPIQRERATGYPLIQGSSLKGRLRAATRAATKEDKISDTDRLAIFGPEAGNAADYAGALSVGDARLLLFPVRSLAGVFAWVTSVDALARFQREAVMIGLPLTWNVPPEPAKDEAWVNGGALVAGEQVVLEEFSFVPRQEQAANIKAIGEWLADNALLKTNEYKYWGEALPVKLCILPQDAFRDFVLYATEVQTHIKLNPNTKTVEGGMLWTSENLPVDTLLYAPLMATKSRANEGLNLEAKQILERLIGIDLTRTQLGGDETTGQGMVALRFVGGKK